MGRLVRSTGVRDNNNITLPILPIYFVIL